MSDQKPSLGQAIDAMLAALEPLEPVSRQVALDAVCAQLGLRGAAPSSEPEAPFRTAVVTDDFHQARSVVTDIRTLKDQKQPKSASQMACLVAYYLQDIAPPAERKTSITTADLETYFKEAGYRLPSKLKQVLIDAKGSGYFKSVGRGEYSLNAVGYNLVVHGLPTGNS